MLDLKLDRALLAQYMELRNSYADLLLTEPVTKEGTLEWLKRDDVEVMGLAEGNSLLGAVILYLNRNGEIAVFAGERNKGVGSKLLDLIEYTAKQKKMQSIWSWVLKDNLIAQRVFEKNGFEKEGETVREYKGMHKQGIEYRKILRQKR